MNKQLEQYLEKIEKSLKPLPASERVDIVEEIKSEMLELEGEGMEPDAIIGRLGDPKELARSYLGEAIGKSNSFSFRKLVSIVVFCAYAGISGIFILPFTSISAVTFLACGILCPLAGIIKLAGYWMGVDIPQIQFVVGSYSAGAVAMLPITLMMGAVCLLLGWGFWRLTIAVIRSLIRKNKRRL